MPATRRTRADALRNRQLALEAATALLARPGGGPLTVEAIAAHAGLGAATVVRAFGGKDALLDAAVSGLLEPLVRRARDLLAQTGPHQALRVFLGELIAFQASRYPINDQLGGRDLPATTSLRADLEAAMAEMIDGARRAGAIRDDLDPDVVSALIRHTAPALARADPPQDVIDAYLTVLFDGLASNS